MESDVSTTKRRRRGRGSKLPRTQEEEDEDIKERGRGSKLPRTQEEEDEDIKEIMSLIETDNHKEFKLRVRNLYRIGSCCGRDLELFKYELLWNIIKCRSTGCIKAVKRGDLGFEVDSNMSMSDIESLRIASLQKNEQPLLLTSQEEEEYYIKEIMRLIKEDYEQEFKLRARKLFRTGSLCGRDMELFKYQLLWNICECKSFGCLTVLGSGDLGFKVDLNLPLPDKSFNPLQYAAQQLSPSLAYALLLKGAHPDVRTADGTLTLDLALQSLKKMITWTPERSVYSLILELCSPGMDYSLETVAILADRMFPGLVYDAIWRYGSEAKLIELAALLMMASRRHKTFKNAGPLGGGNDLITLHPYVIQQIVSLTSEECSLGVTGDVATGLVDCKRKKEEMLSVLLLLEIFERPDVCIEMLIGEIQCRPCMMPKVVKMLQNSGFQLSTKDIHHVSDLIYYSGEGWMVEDITEENNSSEVRDSENPLLIASEDLINTTADGESNYALPENEKLLPLHNQLQKLSSNEMLCNWTPEESILKLIVMLCLPEMRALLEDSELPMQDVETINELACYCAMENKLIELAVLLVAAHGKLLDKITVETEDNGNMNINFRQFINLEFSRLLDVKYRLMGKKVEEDKILYRSCERRISSIISSLPLLEIFEKAGSAIGGYLKSRKHDVPSEDVAGDVVRLFKASGFELEDVQINQPNRISVGEDTINDTLRMIEMNPRSQRPSYFPGTFGVHNPSSSTHNQMRQFSSASHLPGPSVLSTSFGSLWPLKRFDVRLGSCHENALLPEQKEVRATLKQQRIHVFEGGRPQLVPIALGLRRIIRYIWH